MSWLLLPVLLALMMVTSGCIVQPIVAGEQGALPLPPSTEPIIVIAPIAAASGDTVSVGGAGWLAGDTVYVNLEGNQDGVPVGAALAVTTVDAEGRFMASFKVPL
ncbi:MAG: hypothetical protein H3C34_26985, partial [Caldilineaceae bacterium]|nr:hypothetical protein [Caldilineaceae bacterium]